MSSGWLAVLGRFPALAVTILAFTVVLSSPKPSTAAQITCVQRPSERDKCEAILIQGEIVQGDLQRLEAILDPDTNRRPFDPPPSRRASDTHIVYLNSPGGDVLEAMAMGRLIRQLHLHTDAPRRWEPNLSNGTLPMLEGGAGPNGFREACRGPDCVCASACFLIWAGGIKRTGDNILVHRPRATQGMVRQLGVADTRAALTEIRRRVETYLREMEVPSNVITAAMETEPGALVVANMNPSGAWDYGFVPSIVDSLTDACRIPTQRERQQLPRLLTEITSLRERGQPVPSALRQSYESLDGRYVEGERCIWRSISRDVHWARWEWQDARARRRFEAARAENERQEREAAERRLQERAGRAPSTAGAPVLVNIEGIGPLEIAAWFRGLPRSQQQAAIHDVVTVVNSRRPTRPVRWTWTQDADDPHASVLRNPVQVDIENLGLVEVPAPFRTMSQQEQGRIVDAVWAEANGRPSQGPNVPWRFAR